MPLHHPFRSMRWLAALFTPELRTARWTLTVARTSFALMTMANAFPCMLRSRMLSALLALGLLGAGCGDDADSRPEAPRGGDGAFDSMAGDQPGEDARAPASDAVAVPRDDGGGGAVADAGDGEGGDESLFRGPPECEEGGTAVIRVRGAVDGQPVAYEMSSVASLLGQDSLATKDDFEHTPPLSWVVLGWETPMLGFPPGAVVAVHRGWINFAKGGGAGNYCVVSGRLGSPPADAQPTTGSRLFFEVDQVRLREGDENSSAQCTGPVLPASIKGCLYRTIR